MALTSRTISTRDADIAITESDGRGLPVLMLHGSGSSRRIFEHQFDSPLAERHRLIAMDLPGHGDSSDAATPPVNYTLPGLAQTVEDVLAALGIERAVIFGWSLGGHIAIELMSFSHRVAGAMLSGAPPIGHGPIGTLRAFRISFDSMLASKERFSDAEVMRFARMCFGEHMTDAHCSDVRRADGKLRKIMFGSMMSGRCADERKVMETSTIPVAMVNGSLDPFFRQSYVAAIRYAALWDGMCHVIPDAGHAAFAEMPAVFNPMLMRFCDDVALHRIVPRPGKVLAEGPMLPVQRAEQLRA